MLTSNVTAASHLVSTSLGIHVGLHIYGFRYRKIPSGNKSEHSSKTIQARKLSFGYLIELYISNEQEEFELLASSKFRFHL